jgi:hypothetical protein
MRQIVLYLIVFLLIGCKQEKLAVDLFIKNVNIVDIEQGVILSNKYIAIDGEEIKFIFDNNKLVSDSTTVIEGVNKYLIPGLWDMHAHYHSNYHYSNNLLLANGVTGIREMWGKMDSVKSIREKSELGLILSPDIYSSGNIINGEGGWLPFKVVKNEEEAVNEVIKQVDEGVDFIKIYNNLSKDQYIAISKICNQLGISFSGHLPMDVNIWEAMKNQQKSIEHQMGFLENCSSKPEDFEVISKNDDRSAVLDFLVEHFDRKLFDSIANTLSKSNTWLCPTNIYWKNFHNRDNPKYINNQLLEYMPKNIQQFWGTPNEVLKRNKNAFRAGRKNNEFQISLMADLVNKGVKILAGTDFPNPYCYPGFSLHDELQLMVEGGMTPSQALSTATYNPALFLNKEKELGKVEMNYIASLVLLDANPLEDINNTRQILGVFLRGKYLNRSRLDDMLNKVKEYSKASFNEEPKMTIE